MKHSKHYYQKINRRKNKVNIKKLSIFLILAIVLMDARIIVNYEVTKPTVKYNIIAQKKTVAKVIDLSNTHPKEAINQETTEEIAPAEVTEPTSEETTLTNSNQAENSDTLQVVLSTPEPIEVKFENNLIENTFNNYEPTENIEPTPEPEPQPEETSDPTPTEISGSSDIVDTAMSYLGFDYTSGGASPSTGFDCSGFTQYIYGLYGISLNRTAAGQADNGTPISQDELQPGDLVLFSYYGSDSIGHAGIYIGDGEFVHAANPNRGVVIDTIESGYYANNYVTARRVD